MPRRTRVARIVKNPVEGDAQLAAIIRDGSQSDFWDAIESVLDSAIATIAEQLDDEHNELSALPADEYKIKCEVLKAKRRVVLALKRLPQDYAQYLEKPLPHGQVSRDAFDPYFAKEEV